jgi:hypothetical protein
VLRRVTAGRSTHQPVCMSNRPGAVLAALRTCVYSIHAVTVVMAKLSPVVHLDYYTVTSLMFSCPPGDLPLERHLEPQLLASHPVVHHPGRDSSFGLAQQHYFLKAPASFWHFP